MLVVVVVVLFVSIFNFEYRHLKMILKITITTLAKLLKFTLG